MDTQTVIILAAGIALLAAIVVWLLARNRRVERLHTKYGPEYDRVVRETGAAGKAAREFDRREKRVEHLHIRPVGDEDRARFAAEWQRAQARFVDDPAVAVRDADHLVQTVMIARGYPVADFEQRAADISVDHPVVVENYRAARALALRHDSGEATTEDLRQSMVHYRALFAELLEEPVMTH